MARQALSATPVPPDFLPFIFEAYCHCPIIHTSDALIGICNHVNRSPCIKGSSGMLLLYGYGGGDGGLKLKTLHVLSRLTHDAARRVDRPGKEFAT
eukprot:scaffold217265_cov36-Prasinocladus_malaysianus.AAC.1